ncbi:EAL domain-containing protein [Thermosulfurimonas sp. F29]|uniref:EAL domain-containing protein n=1 Tax=Thermosulfurimonas sp. F29 TaxID=2867247 RepID=UPI001C83EEBA|nr:EAL domain-containing protein [Thermosulfurimonas sp. F29]MBX6423321.1 EAL domain-containing protein [Thermosulfurimonas sp. F29]
MRRIAFEPKDLFRFEPIVDRNGRCWGVEVLFHFPWLPNAVLFARPNPSLEKHVFDLFARHVLPELNGRAPRYTFNFSVQALVEHRKAVSKALERHPRLLIEITEHSDHNDERLQSELKALMSDFSGRFLLDDFLSGPKAPDRLNALEPHLAALKMDLDSARRCYVRTQIPLILERIETPDDLREAKHLGAQYYQGRLFDILSPVPRSS